MVNELLKQILGELKDLKSDICDLKENQVRMQNDISKMQEDISSLKENQVKMQENISKMQEDISELKQGQVRLEKKLDEVSNKLDDLEAKNAQRHIEINSRLDEIIDDVEFIKHKEFKNEEDIFKLKKKLAV